MHATFLVSLCNNGEDAPYLLTVTTDGRVTALDHPIAASGPVSGATGCTRFGDGYLIALQSEGGQILCLDGDLRPVRIATVDNVVDAHGMVAVDGGVLIASTGRDQIVKLDTEFRFAGFVGKPSESPTDSLHVNDLCAADEAVYASRFGQIRLDGIRRGEIFDANAGTVLFDGFNEPHSLVCDGGILHVLDSGTGSLFCLDPKQGPQRRLSITGYARGLAMNDDWILVGKSALRVHGRGDGFRHAEHLYASEGGQAEFAASGVFIINRHDNSARFIPTARYGAEIYQILAMHDGA